MNPVFQFSQYLLKRQVFALTGKLRFYNFSMDVTDSKSSTDVTANNAETARIEGTSAASMVGKSGSGPNSGPMLSTGYLNGNRGSEYIQGPIGELVDSVIVPIKKGKQVEIDGSSSTFGDGVPVQATGIGDRFEKSGYAFSKVVVPYLMRPFVNAGDRHWILEILLRDEKIQDELSDLAKFYSNEFKGRDASAATKIDTLRRFLIGKKDKFPLLYASFLVTQSYNPDALLLLIINKFDLGFEIYGMSSLGEIKAEQSVFSHSKGAISGVSDLLKKEKGGIVLFGGDVHLNHKPLYQPAVMRNAGSVLAGLAISNMCHYLNLTILCMSVEDIMANQKAFIVEERGIEYGRKGYNFFLKNLQELEKLPAGYARLYTINQGGEGYEYRMILVVHSKTAATTIDLGGGNSRESAFSASRNKNGNAFPVSRNEAGLSDSLPASKNIDANNVNLTRLAVQSQGLIASVRRVHRGISKSEVKKEDESTKVHPSTGKSIFSLAPPEGLPCLLRKSLQYLRFLHYYWLHQWKIYYQLHPSCRETRPASGYCRGDFAGNRRRQAAK